MFGILMWIVIVGCVVFINVGKKGKSQDDRAQEPTERQTESRWEGYQQSGAAMRQQATKERLQKKYGQPTGGAKSPEGEILKRAKASVEQDFGKDRVRESWSAASKYDGGKVGDAAASMVQEAKARQQEIERRIAEKLAQAEAEQSDIMKQVEELMVKGPDTSLAFERDFVAEGLELLSRIQG